MSVWRVWLIALVLFLFAGTAAAADRIAVGVPMANVRSGPGLQYKVLWKLEKYHPLKLVRTKGDWYYFQDYEGDRAWIHKKVTSGTNTVIVNKNRVNVRSNPGTDNRIVFTVERGVPFLVLGKQGSWLHIRHSDGDEGWIHDSLVW